MLNIWFHCDFTSGTRTSFGITLYVLKRVLLKSFVFGNCFTSCLHPSELMHAKYARHDRDVVVPDFPTSLFRGLAHSSI